MQWYVYFFINMFAFARAVDVHDDPSFSRELVTNIRCTEPWLVAIYLYSHTYIHVQCMLSLPLQRMLTLSSLSL